MRQVHMQLLLQRVSYAQVKVNEQCIGKIDRGLLVFIGLEKDDTLDNLNRLAKKLLAYRVFPDHESKMNLSVRDIDGSVLAVSQFTLAANTKKGLRPSFSSAASPNQAQKLYDDFIHILKNTHPRVETGRFGADMQISLINDGPVTFLLKD